MQADAVARNVSQRLIDVSHDLLDKLDEFADRLILKCYVAFEREIGRIDLQQQPVACTMASYSTASAVPSAAR